MKELQIGLLLLFLKRDGENSCLSFGVIAFFFGILLKT
jgi:hypothetical protein